MKIQFILTTIIHTARKNNIELIVGDTEKKDLIKNTDKFLELGFDMERRATRAYDTFKWG